jgi:hypothetical protein
MALQTHIYPAIRSSLGSAAAKNKKMLTRTQQTIDSKGAEHEHWPINTLKSG